MKKELILRLLLSWFIGLVVGSFCLSIAITLEDMSYSVSNALEQFIPIFFGGIVFGAVVTALVLLCWLPFVVSRREWIEEHPNAFILASTIGLTAASYFVTNAFFGFQLLDEPPVAVAIFLAQLVAAATSSYHALRSIKKTLEKYALEHNIEKIEAVFD